MANEWRSRAGHFAQPVPSIVLVVSLLTLVAAQCRRPDIPDADAGHSAQHDDAGSPPSEQMRKRSASNIEKLRQLEALGYASGVEEATGPTGVLVHDSRRAWNSLNLYVSGHDAMAYLMTMAGQVMHTWSYPYEQALGKAPPTDDAMSWRRVHLYPNGDLLAIYEGQALIKITWDSILTWVYEGRCHHQVAVSEDGVIYVLSREAKVIERIHDAEPILEDFISLLDDRGNVLDRISILDCFRNSVFYWPLFRTVSEKLRSDIATGRHAPGDVLHTNSIYLIDGANAGRAPAFKKGNILLSMRALDMLAVIDPDRRSVVWVSRGMWVTQHDPVMLPDGRMLVFDNRGNRGSSRVIEFDPWTQEVFWVYQGDPPKAFLSRACGANQRLPNGNTLISESDRGRAFEVTRSGEVVWEFLSPHRTGERGDLVARLFDMVRLPVEWAPQLLEGKSPDEDRYRPKKSSGSAPITSSKP